jgi:hypothetical protein
MIGRPSATLSLAQQRVEKHLQALHLPSKGLQGLLQVLHFRGRGLESLLPLRHLRGEGLESELLQVRLIAIAGHLVSWVIRLRLEGNEGGWHSTFNV